jgi:hypothetical protein
MQFFVQATVFTSKYAAAFSLATSSGVSLALWALEIMEAMIHFQGCTMQYP